MGSSDTQLKLSGLDEIDVKLLEALDSNSRATYAELAQAVGLSRDGVKYRIARLEKKGVILDFSLEIDTKPLGLSNKVLLNLSFISMDEGLSKAFEDFIQKLATSYYRTTGEYDYVVVLATRDNEHLNALIQQLKAAFSEQIRSIGVVPVVG